MTDGKLSDIKVAWRDVTIIEKFASVLYPLDIFDLLTQLPTIGYVVPELSRRGTPEPGKPVATKGDIEIVIQQDNRTLGVRGRDPELAVAAFRDLREFYSEQLDPSPGLVTHYLEFVGDGTVKSGADPVHALSRYWEGFAPLKQLGSVLDANTTNFGVELVPFGEHPNDPEWFHVTIQPHVASSSKRYRVRWVWRGADIEALLETFSAVDETLRKLIARIEGR